MWCAKYRQAGPSGRAVQGEGLRAARLLRSWVRILPWAWMFVVSVVCCAVHTRLTARTMQP